LKKDKHGQKAFFLNDIFKIVFGAGSTEVVVVNLAGIVDNVDAVKAEAHEPEEIKLEDVKHLDSPVDEPVSSVPVFTDEMMEHSTSEEKEPTLVSLDDPFGDEPPITLKEKPKTDDSDDEFDVVEELDGEPKKDEKKKEEKEKPKEEEKVKPKEEEKVKPKEEEKVKPKEEEKVKPKEEEKVKPKEEEKVKPKEEEKEVKPKLEEVKPKETSKTKRKPRSYQQMTKKKPNSV
jgi:hypothetical protein